MLALGLNDRSPLRLLALDISLLLLTFRTDDRGRTYAAVGVTEGGAPARNLSLYDGDVLELVSRLSGVRRLHVTFARSSNCLVRLTEVDATALPGARVAGRVGPAPLPDRLDVALDVAA